MRRLLPVLLALLPLPAVADNAVTLSIRTSVPAMLTAYELTGGDWVSAPVPGAVFRPGEPVTLVNRPDTPGEAPGGFLTLTPAGGGAVTVTWSRAGAAVRATAATRATGIPASAAVSGSTVSVVIGD
ncbi:MAG TPA: hypothetical protein VD995_29630 [Azospirillum sp.]|nr:hypothetical protein [Azospirillum sp.]